MLNFFDELLKLSNRLHMSIVNERKAMGFDCTSVYCRFLDLLGDFNETYG